MKKYKKYMKSFFLVTSSLFLLAGCGDNGESEEESAGGGETDEVTIGVYGGDWESQIKEAGLEQFEEETGITVNVQAGADAEWYSQLQASGGNDPLYDVLILQPDTITKGISADLLQPLDAENIPNLEDIYPSVRERFTVDGNLYAAGFSMGQLGIAYRKDLVEEEPEAWMDLWEPEFEDSLGISSPSYSAGLQFFSGIVNSLGGEESNPEDIDQTFEKLNELNSNVVAYPDNPGTIQTLLERGEISAVPFWDGRTFALQESGLDLGFTYPEEGPVAAVASWAITKGSPNLENAYKLVNYLLEPEVQANFAELSYYGMSNSNVEYSEELEERIQVGEEFYEQLKWVDYETVTPQLNDITQRWTDTFGGAQ
ncbi:ABC transporter substrate-binding protein [Alteribacillus iranensis]|uniref:Putative spermidine/putrescine transport system substrate-binding protein n=1 Tax=Alteribacillus iranensis TaxID=930128 RepID=A0A1I2BGN6_9BACI|nr:ABC transporter substrate-binding protein [Alteribacillus iranensis]SFE54443.1 putative spermidine/putrescine transport system substrate-binding protein [Alteribacillus iranensis]